MAQTKSADEEEFNVKVRVVTRPAVKETAPEQSIPNRGRGVVAPKKTSRLSRKRRLQFVVLLVVVGGVWLGMRAMSAPVTGRPIAATDTLQTVSSTTKEAPSSPATTVSENPFFELSLPAGYKPQENNQTVPGLSYQKSIIKPGAFGSIIISIAIKPMPDGGVQSDSSYQLRAQSPARYKITQQSTSDSTVTVANDAQAASVVAFWPHGGSLATISLTAGIDNPASNDNADIMRALEPILNGWQWRLTR